MPSLPFQQDAPAFLLSYFWGCRLGHELSSRCRQRLDRLHDAESLRPQELRKIREQLSENLIDCYVHTRVCTRCRPVDSIACRVGHELLDIRDRAAEEAQRIGVEHSEQSKDSLNPEQLQHLNDRQIAERMLLGHMRECEQCTSRRPVGRFSVAAWNIEAARSLRPFRATN